MSNKTFAPAILSGLISAIAWPVAQAQPVPPAAAASAPGTVTLDQVMVTSQKRKEDIRKVPLSISVLSGNTLQENHINDLTDLTRSVPNVSFSTQAGAGLSTISIRGISSQAGSATVAVYLDDVSLTTRNLYSQGTAEPRFFDTDRVEVLRGPQGTLYGASSLGGTIKFISNQPDPKRFGGNAYGELSSTSHGGTNHVLQGVLNVPLVKDNVAFRIGVQTGKDSGYIDQVSPTTLAVVDKGINGTQWDVLKLALKANLMAGWSVTPALFYQRFKSNDIDAAYLNVGDYQIFPPAVPPGPALQLFQTSKIVREPATDKLTVPSLTLNGDVGFGDITGVLSTYTRRFDRIQDGTYVNVPYIASVIADPTLSATVARLPSAVQLNNTIDQSSIELRLASKDYDPSRGPFTWLAGVYFAKTKTQVFDNEPIFGINAAFTAAGRDINDPNELADSFPGAFTGDSSYYSARHYNDKQTSIFGEITYNVSPTLRGIAGVRVLKASQHFTREGDYYYAGGPTTALIDSSANAVTPRFAINWEATPSTAFYANVAKGFRLGSANRPVPLTPLVLQDLANMGLPGVIPAAFEPDSLWSYEIGAKASLLDNRLSLNVAAFHIDWKNIQQNVVLPLSAFDFETNVGRATSTGIEVETRFRATDALTLTAAGSYTRAVFAEDMPALGTTAGELNVRKGDPIQGVPKYSARLGFEYRFKPLASGDAFVRASSQWTGSSRGSFVRSSKDYERPGYVKVDASAGLTFDRWEFTVFAKNLTNNHKIIQQPLIQSVPQAYYLRPRTIGVTAALDF